MREIPLLHRRRVVAFALVDDEDFDQLSRRKWHLYTSPHGNQYAVRTEDHRVLLMHRVLLGLTDRRQEVDHRNRDGLDNRRENLRVCSHAENMQNVPAVGRSPFRGVWWNSRRDRWEADGWQERKKRTKIGFFVNELDAAKAAAQWRIEHMTHSVEDTLLVGA